MRYAICVVGLGYVGITLAVVLADKGFSVIGIDTNKRVVRSLNKGIPHIFEPEIDELLKKYINKRIFVQDHYPEALPKTVIICVSTPVDMKCKRPDLTNLKHALKDVGKRIGNGSTLIIRSTVPVGTCSKIVLPAINRCGKDLKLAFCPERTIQGQALRELQELPQIIGGKDRESIKAAKDIFGKITPRIITVSSLEAAEIIKLICNSHTDLIYSYGNEVAIMAEKYGLDPIELINSANLDYPRPDLILPGFVGGGCLTKDPYLLMESFSEFNYAPVLVKSARLLNEGMPVHVAKNVIKRLESLNKGKGLKEAKIFVLGFAYKGSPATDDVRGSPAGPFINHLKKHTKIVYGHDPLVSNETIKNLGAEPLSVEEGFRDADCVVFLNNHPFYKSLNILELIRKMKRPPILIDCWRVFDNGEMSKVKDLIYGGIGY